MRRSQGGCQRGRPRHASPPAARLRQPGRQRGSRAPPNRRHPQTEATQGSPRRARDGPAAGAPHAALEHLRPIFPVEAWGRAAAAVAAPPASGSSPPGVGRAAPAGWGRPQAPGTLHFKGCASRSTQPRSLLLPLAGPGRFFSSSHLTAQTTSEGLPGARGARSATQRRGLPRQGPILPSPPRSPARAAQLRDARRLGGPAQAPCSTCGGGWVPRGGREDTLLCLEPVQRQLEPGCTGQGGERPQSSTGGARPPPACNQGSTAQPGMAQYGLAQPSTAQHSPVRLGMALHSPVQPSTARYSLAWPSTAWYSLV